MTTLIKTDIMDLLHSLIIKVGQALNLPQFGKRERNVWRAWIPNTYNYYKHRTFYRRQRGFLIRRDESNRKKEMPLLRGDNT